VPDEIRLCRLVLTPYCLTLHGFTYMVFLGFKFFKRGLMYTVHSTGNVICTTSSHATKNYVDTWFELICSRHTLFYVCRAILWLIRRWVFKQKSTEGMNDINSSWWDHCGDICGKTQFKQIELLREILDAVSIRKTKF